ncbi:hypothetical protein ACIBJF_32850 [Streptomyces sp. NPDC050743]|uniref:hypothetical protein n=1 Tax=Streptomyces sp. NPDC050743 TaxID=3365634 RepID=UPI00379661CB
MDFRITAEEEALVFRLAELVDGGTQPLETQLVEELGSDIRQQLDGLKAKGWTLAREAAGGMMVVDLTGPAWQAVRSRRDVGR